MNHHTTTSRIVNYEHTPHDKRKIPRKPVASTALAQHTKASPLARWRDLARSTQLVIVTILLALIILVVGLSAGLSTRHRTFDLPLPSSHSGPFTGDLTYYGPGLGACGATSSNGDRIVSVSHYIFDAVNIGTNPNSNPLCGKTIRAKRTRGDGKTVSVDLKVVDRCTGCQPRDLDVAENTFSELADVDLGRVKVDWSWLEDLTEQVTG